MEEEPDEHIVLPKKGIEQLEGDFLKGRLLCVSEATRIDWHYRPSKGGPTANEFPIVGTQDEATESFFSILSPWFPLMSGMKIIRIAWGAVLLHPTSSREESYTLLNELLEEVSIKPESSNFLYQINNRMDSTTREDIRINRLTKWSTVKMPVATIKILSESPPDLNANIHFSARLELDINTVPESEIVILHSSLESLTNELIQIGREISTR